MHGTLGVCRRKPSGPIEVPTLFDTYNAKWRSGAEVAKSFVPPPQFTRIVKRRNSLIVGPRGSGKTTLLKMLTQPALEAWQGRFAARYQERVDYTGVFIATDVSWNSQLSALGADDLEPRHRQVLQMAALTAHTHKALVEAMEARARTHAARHPSERQPREIAQVRGLAQLWKINPTLPSYYALKMALRARLQGVHEIAQKERLLGDHGRSTRLANQEFLQVPLLVSCRNGVEQFNDVYSEPDRPWALLFDELELMPAGIREELFQFLRTFPGVIVFKLALSPFDETLPAKGSSAGPQQDQDYDFIPLWYAKKRKAYRFCTALWRGITAQSTLAGRTPEQVLGRSLLDTDSRDWRGPGTAYTRGSPHWRYLTELSRRDGTFRKYLAANGIDLDAIDRIKGTDRASTLRKVFPLVVARVEYAKLPDGGGSNTEDEGHLRSRKISGIYTGATSIFDISEGNPRILIALASRMLDRLGDGEKSISTDIQVDEVSQAVNRFRALVRTIVVPMEHPKRFPRALLSLLEPIGRGLQKAALTEPFSAEPPGSFIVDADVSQDVVRMLGYALNVGAIMYIPDRDGGEEMLSIERLGGRRFRMSYLFAARYGVVPRLGRGVSLRKLLGGTGDRGLFDGGEVRG